jgi:glycosyltransferase involved in cell wall biosynthesis
MKILFTFNGLPHYYNPVLNRLNKLPNTNVSVVIPSSGGLAIGAGVYQSDSGVEFKVDPLEEYKTFYGKSFFKDFSKYLAKEKPDIIVTVWPYILGFVLIPGLLKKIRRLGIKLILKDIPFLTPKYHEVYKFYMSGGLYNEKGETMSGGRNPFQLLSYFILAQIRKYYLNMVDAHVDYIEDAFEIFGSYGVKKEKIFIIYNSPDTDKLLSIKNELENEEPLLPPNNNRLIHVGRLVKWKRVDMLIDSVSKIASKFEKVELIIVGDGPELNNLKRQVKELNLEKNVIFTGAIYDTKLLGKYLNESAIYVIAGMGGLSINEAMCFGKPVICSVCDGTEKKLVKEDINGKFFTNGDCEDLTRKIEYLLLNHQLIKSMGNNSLRIIKEEINIDVVIKGYTKAFEFVNVKN